MQPTAILGMFLRLLPGFSDCCLKIVSQATRVGLRDEQLAIATMEDIQVEVKVSSRDVCRLIQNNELGPLQTLLTHSPACAH